MNYFDRALSNCEKMIYYFEKYKESLKCKKENEASKYLQLAHHYLQKSQMIKEEKKAE